MADCLDGKVSLVCGASDGIGAAIAHACAAAGAKVILVARRALELRRVLESLPGDGHRLLTADFAARSSVEDLCHSVAALDRLDILINNTGGPPPKGPLETSIEDVEQALQAHLFTAMRLSQAALPVMRRHGYGRIIQIVSVTARVPLVHLTASNIARGAVLAWAKTLSEALAPEGITVNNVLPGYTSTARLGQLIDETAARQRVSTSDVEASVLRGIPAGRFGLSEEIAGAALYLASPAAAYVTGTSLPVDGGFIRTV